MNSQEWKEFETERRKFIDRLSALADRWRSNAHLFGNAHTIQLTNGFAEQLESEIRTEKGDNHGR